MTTYNIKSTVISNRDATPKVLTDNFVSGGEVRESQGYVLTSTTTDTVGTVYRLCQVPSNARVTSLRLTADAFGSAGALNVGVYWPTFIPVGAGLSSANAAAVIHTTFFASALAVSAATTVTDIINNSATNTVLKQEQPLWYAIGLLTDPGIDLDICAEVQAALAASGYIGLKAAYVE